MPGLLSKDRITARSDFNRWLIAPAALGIHLCIGSVYAWSLFNPALIKRVGVVTGAADDWTLKNVVWVFTVAIVFLGLSAAIAGKWLEKVGPRTVGVVSACCWSGGFLLGGIGIVTGQLWLLYLGYGVIGGCGLGLGYVSPVSTLIRWFPDRRGMATGIAIMGFGGGAMLAKPMIGALLKFYYQGADYLGSLEQIKLVTEGGRRFAEVSGSLREVVVIGANDVAAMMAPGDPGVYLVGTGSIGVAETFFTLAAIYFVVMLCAAFAYRLPAPGWKPAGWEPPPEDDGHGKMITRHDVDIDQALKTPQFYQLWIVLCF
ncbi:MAG: MFS transporter, partial [Gammaproteobacteria bacterium]